MNPKAKVGLFTADVKTWRGDTTFAMVQTLAGDPDPSGHFQMEDEVPALVKVKAEQLGAP